MATCFLFDTFPFCVRALRLLKCGGIDSYLQKPDSSDPEHDTIGRDRPRSAGSTSAVVDLHASDLDGHGADSLDHKVNDELASHLS